MQHATMSPEEYFDQRWKSYEQELEVRNARKAERQKACDACGESILVLTREREKKVALKKQASENGLDTSPLDKDIARIDAQLDELRERHTELDRLRTEPELPAPYDRRFLGPVLEHLRKNGCAKAEVLPCIEDAASLVSVSPDDITIDKNGMVTEAAVRLANHKIGEVPISPDRGRYLKSFRPEPLKWLPPLAGEPPQVEQRWRHYESARAFIVEDQQALLLPTEYGFRVQRWSRDEGEEILVTGAHAPFVLASDILSRALTEAGGTLHVDQVYSNKFLAKVRDEIAALTLEAPRWIKNTEYPDSDTVLGAIREDLSLLVAAPWSDGLREHWAKLKHTLENGERPRLWRKQHVDHYGFRLRTRDHTWLVGELFVDRSQPPGKPGEPIQGPQSSETYYSTVFRRVGRMYVTVHESDD
jgi:hypothetical protein